MIIVGIDPGQTGAIAALDPDGSYISVVDMPVLGGEPSADDVASLLEAIANPTDLFVGLEEPFAVRNKGAQGLLTQGIGYGILLGVVGSMRLKHERIKPAAWKRELGLPMGKDISYSQKKKNSIAHAKRLWPELDFRVKDDGRAEALLIAECLRRRTGAGS